MSLILVFRYQCRLFSDKDGAKKIDPYAKENKLVKNEISSTGHDLSKYKRPPIETAQQSHESSKNASSATSTPSSMGDNPGPNIGSKWEEEQKKHKLKKKFLIFIIGFVIFSLTVSAVPAVSKFLSDIHCNLLYVSQLIKKHLLFFCY